MQANDATNPWQFIPDTSQEMAYHSPCNETLYTGARGPGKTDTQLHVFRRNVGIGYGPFWRGVIFDREYKNLDDLISKSKRWFTRLGDGARFLSSNSDLKWVWPTGEELLFRSIKVKDDYWNYHGQEFPFIGWNELCKYPTLELYDQMLSCNRSSFTPEKDTPNHVIVDKDGVVIADRSKGILCNPIPLQVFSTTNPYGPGHNAVKSRFIDCGPYGIPIFRTTTVFDPKLKQDVEVTRSQITFFGTWRENPYIDTQYIAGLIGMADENMRAAWELGDWDVVAGGALDDVWDRSRCIIPRFQVPDNWRVDRALDWGSTHPYSVGFWAEANGEEAKLPDGRTFCPPRGTLIQIGELYGASELGTNKGNRKSAGQLAQDIRTYENLLVFNKWISSLPFPGPADNQIRDVRESDVDTIEKKMSDRDIRWTASDKSRGSRRNGLQLIRERLEATKRGKPEPGLMFMDNCRASIGTIPTLPRDDKNMDDIDTTAEDHAYDMVRYRVLKSSNRDATNVKVIFAT